LTKHHSCFRWRRIRKIILYSSSWGSRLNILSLKLSIVTLRFVQARDLWHKQIAVYSNSWNKQGEHARCPCHLQFSVWRLLWALGTRFHAHLVDMQISGSWWRPSAIFAVGRKGCNRTIHAYRFTCGVVARAARFHFHEMTWSTLREVECNRLDVKVSRSRTRSREPARCTCDPQRSGALRCSRTSRPRRAGLPGLGASPAKRDDGRGGRRRDKTLKSLLSLAAAAAAASSANY